MRNSTLNVLILGATGMVGSEVLAQSLANDDIKSVLTVGRRSSGTNHPKLQEVLHDDFLDYSALEAKLTDIDIVLYCLGVYQAHVSKEQFWEITVRYLEELIRLQKSCSALGSEMSRKAVITHYLASVCYRQKRSSGALYI